MAVPDGARPDNRAVQQQQPPRFVRTASADLLLQSSNNNSNKQQQQQHLMDASSTTSMMAARRSEWETRQMEEIGELFDSEISSPHESDGGSMSDMEEIQLVGTTMDLGVVKSAATHGGAGRTMRGQLLTSADGTAKRTKVAGTSDAASADSPASHHEPALAAPLTALNGETSAAPPRDGPAAHSHSHTHAPTKSMGGSHLLHGRREASPADYPPKQKRARRVFSHASSAVTYGRDNAYNNDFCEACHQSGEFVCCESCPRSFHFVCAEPPCDYDDVSKLDHWFCNVCLTSQRPPPPAPPGIFHQLLENVARMNPVSFSLPDEIKRYFSGVSWNPSTGDYVDPEDSKPDRGNQRGFFTTDAELFRLTTDDGRILLCNLCNKSALKGPILVCDYCPLAWHLDCMTPPMTAPLPLHKKWMCPNHAEQTLPRIRKVRRHQQEVYVTDPHFRNGGDIEVDLGADADEEEFNTDSRFDKKRRVVYKLPEQSIRLAFHDKITADTRNPAISSDQRKVTDHASTLPTTAEMTTSVLPPTPDILQSYNGVPAAEHVDPQVSPHDTAQQSSRSAQGGDFSLATSHVTAGEAALWLSSLTNFYQQVSEFMQQHPPPSQSPAAVDDGSNSPMDSLCGAAAASVTPSPAV